MKPEITEANVPTDRRARATGEELLAVDYEHSAVGESVSLPTASASAPAAVDSPASAAVERFRSCRWRKPAEENGDAECCTHRDVLPLTGTRGFDPEAWCPDCAFFKLRRTPRKNNH